MEHLSDFPPEHNPDVTQGLAPQQWPRLVYRRSPQNLAESKAASAWHIAFIRLRNNEAAPHPFRRIDEIAAPIVARATSRQS